MLLNKYRDVNDLCPWSLTAQLGQGVQHCSTDTPQHSWCATRHSTNHKITEWRWLVVLWLWQGNRNHTVLLAHLCRPWWTDQCQPALIQVDLNFVIQAKHT